MISEGPTPRRLTTWTFWRDAFPEICGIIAGVVALAAAATFVRTPHRTG